MRLKHETIREQIFIIDYHTPYCKYNEVSKVWKPKNWWFCSLLTQVTKSILPILNVIMILQHFCLIRWTFQPIVHVFKFKKSLKSIFFIHFAMENFVHIKTISFFDSKNISELFYTVGSLTGVNRLDFKGNKNKFLLLNA